MKSKVTFEFEDRRIADILAMILEDDTDLMEMINNKIIEFNEASENEDEVPIEQIAMFSVDIDNNKDVEYIITCEYE